MTVSVISGLGALAIATFALPQSTDTCRVGERSNHRNFGEADEDHGADHLRN